MSEQEPAKANSKNGVVIAVVILAVVIFITSLMLVGGGIITALILTDHDGSLGSLFNIGGRSEYSEKNGMRKGAALGDIFDVKLSGLPYSATELTMVKIKAGDFKMGDKGRSVTLTKDFWIGKYEVTQAQWKAVMSGVTFKQSGGSSDPSRFKGDNLPVECVSWTDAMQFCKELTRQERAAGRLPAGYEYSLPTEAQWEYACRGGQSSRGYTYSGSNTPGDVAWYYENSGDSVLYDSTWDPNKVSSNNCKTHPVGKKKANELGLYDMNGNVFEWCRDRYESGYASDPEFLTGNSGSGRVARGGSWCHDAWYCRSASRSDFSPVNCFAYFGFRLALVPVK